MVQKASHARSRLDCLLVERGICSSREKAQRAILAGLVEVNGARADKPGLQISQYASLSVLEKERYVSRGGLKLEAALTQFDIAPDNKVCLDVGASTGGFTDCLLQHGARRVYAVDVGHGQLAWQLRSDPRVVTHEKVNARYLTGLEFPDEIELAVIDVSFISLNQILPAVANVLGNDLTGDSRVQATRSGAKVIICLVKPQFELGYQEVSQGRGVIRDELAQQRAVDKVTSFVAGELPQWQAIGTIPSPILGAKGNKEFLTCLSLRR